MNIEEANQLMIKNTFYDFNERSVSGNNARFNINLELVNSLVEYRQVFGPPSDTELLQHHTATASFVKTVNCN